MESDFHLDRRWVYLVAREIEREARRSADLFDWAGIEADAAETVDYARRASARMLECQAEDGVDVHDPAAVLGALRFPDVRSIERRLRMQPPPGLARLEPWKAGTARVLATDVTSAAKHQLDGTRVVLASLDVHDLMRDVLVSALPDLGAEVVVLPNDSHAEAIASAAIAEDADAVVVSTYNGSALTQGRLLSSALADAGFNGVTVMGGMLNPLQSAADAASAFEPAPSRTTPRWCRSRTTRCTSLRMSSCPSSPEGPAQSVLDDHVLARRVAGHVGPDQTPGAELRRRDFRRTKRLKSRVASATHLVDIPKQARCVRPSTRACATRSCTAATGRKPAVVTNATSRLCAR